MDKRFTSKGMPKQLAWWPDWEFTNDLLLHPNRPRLMQVHLSANTSFYKMETILDICFKVKNASDCYQRDLKVFAVILDCIGIILTDGHSEAMTCLPIIEPGQAAMARIQWLQKAPAKAYHLLLVLEDSSGHMIDTISGDYVLK